MSVMTSESKFEDLWSGAWTNICMSEITLDSDSCIPGETVISSYPGLPSSVTFPHHVKCHSELQLLETLSTEVTKDYPQSDLQVSINASSLLVLNQ